MKWPWSKQDQIEVLSPLEAYDRWSASYAAEANPIKNLSDTLVEKFLPDLANKNILDAGCGTGKFCSLAEQKHAAKIVGLDLSSKMIAHANKQCTKAILTCGDISVTPIETNFYDVIICALVLGHVKELKPPLTNLLNGLKINGLLIITDFHPFLTMMKSKRTFKDQASGKLFEVAHHLHLLDEYFRIVAECNARIDVFEEPLYNGSPVVFGMKIFKNS